MIFRTLVSALLLFSGSEEIARVDLTEPPKTTDAGTQDNWVRGGGMLHHQNPPHPLPGTPTLSLVLTRIVAVPGNHAVKQAVEVIATNTGNEAVSIPVGTDPVPLLKSTEASRRTFLFSVMLGKSRRVGSAESASSKGHPESSILLQPGGKAAFLLPVIVFGSHVPDDQISVSLELWRKDLEGDRDWNQAVGEAIHSENTLPLP